MATRLLFPFECALRYHTLSIKNLLLFIIRIEFILQTQFSEHTFLHIFSWNYLALLTTNTSYANEWDSKCYLIVSKESLTEFSLNFWKYKIYVVYFIAIFDTTNENIGTLLCKQMHIEQCRFGHFEYMTIASAS